MTKTSRILTIAFSILLLAGCPQPANEPNPEPQKPAPNADPRPTGKSRTIVFSISQEEPRVLDILYSFDAVTPPLAHTRDLVWNRKIVSGQSGIAKLVVTTDDQGITDIHCLIGIEGGSILDESSGRNSCEVTTIIN